MKRKALLLLTGLLCLAAFPIYGTKVYQKSDYTDFGVYYQAASRAKMGLWNQVYTLQDGASPFRYAPQTLLFFRPFAELPPLQARMLWFGLQYLWFSLGFWLLYRCLKIAGARDPAVALSLGILFVFRLMLDCFTIGQISSLVFFCLSLAATFWILGRPFAAASALFPPALLKIGPGFLYFVFLAARSRQRRLAWLTPLLLLALLTTTFFLWKWQEALPLLRSWASIVAQDSVYYDASHYGSQSLKSGLLRLARAGWLSDTQALGLHLSALALGCTALAGFWLLRRPRGFLGRALSYSLGIFAFLWFMPETFKYSLTALGIPVVFLLALPERRLSTTATLVFGFLSLSMPGKDIVGDPIFFWVQRQSLPLLATLALGFAVFREALLLSRPSPLARFLGSIFRARPVGPWNHLPVIREQDCTVEATLLLPLPLMSNHSLQASTVLETLQLMAAGFGNFFPGGHEFLLVPYGDRISADHPLLRAARDFASAHPELQILDPCPDSGRGSALRQAFLHSRGRKIFFLHLEQPAQAGFYEGASKLLDQGVSLVRGNRRIGQSRFRVAVSLLPLVYGRHRLGLAFNHLVRAILPIETTDTHSGTLALARRAALPVFALQSTGGFLFELELALVIRGHGLREAELPLRLSLSEEKSRSRMSHETLTILFGLPRLAVRYRQGCYSPHSAFNHQLTADDWGLSPGVNQAVLELAEKGVLKRASAMAHGRYLDLHVHEVASVRGFEFGLHFDLTHGKRSPTSVLLEWLNPFSDREALKSALRLEFQAQIRKLREAGISPVYLDGHHHIHLVPGVLETLADSIRVEGIRTVRLPYDPSLWLSRKFPLLILCLLAKGSVRRLGFQSLPCLYPQPSLLSDFGRFRALLSARPASEVIVHPAQVDDLAALGIPDSYTEGRVGEFLALRMLAN